MTFDRWLALVSILFGAAGCSLAVLFFRRSEKHRIPTFVVHPNRRLLAHPALTQLQDLSVVHGNRKVGGNGITEVQIHFWNSGNLPLLHSEILEPFAIRIEATILSFAITKLSRPVVRLQASPAESAEGELLLSFAVLEPGDGGTLRIVYDGPTTARIGFRGACVGAAKPTVLPSDPMYFSTPAKRLFKASEPLVMSIIIGVVMWSVIVGVGWGVRRLFDQRVLLFVTVSIGVIFVAALIGSLLWFQYKNLTAKYVPPDIKSD